LFLFKDCPGVAMAAANDIIIRMLTWSVAHLLEKLDWSILRGGGQMYIPGRRGNQNGNPGLRFGELVVASFTSMDGAKFRVRHPRVREGGDLLFDRAR
jgi:hypothetical protein